LGYPLDHTTVYHNVQAAGERVLTLRQVWMHQTAGKVSVVGGDLTYLQCRGDRLAVAVAVDAQTGVTLDIEILDNEETETLEGWLKPLLELVGAKVLITDDQDGFKAVADKAGVSHQICRQHVTRNVLDFVAKTAERILSSPPPVPDGLDVTPEQLLEDLALLEWIMLGHPENGSQLLAELYARYTVLAYCASAQRRKLLNGDNVLRYGIACATIFYAFGSIGSATLAIALPWVKRRLR
jgi:hypothetical protein